jgi:predicted DNA-binding transcriptional regulator AlpA
MSNTTSSKTPRVRLGKRPRRDHRQLGADSKRFIDRKRLLQKLGLSYPSVWKRMRAGKFPLPYVDGQKNFWDEDEVDAYLAALPRRTYPTKTEI